jgi:hypothetical protein
LARRGVRGWGGGFHDSDIEYRSGLGVRG